MGDLDVLVKALSTGDLSRREFVSRGLALGLSTSVVGSFLAACAQNPAKSGGPVDLTFVTWSYGVDTIKSNISKFESQNANTHVKFQDFSWLNYHDTMVTRFVGKTPTDLAYSSDHWLQEWAAAGWLVPLDSHFSQVSAYKADYFPYVTSGMTYNGKVYGIPYYADTWAFLYNADHLKRAGLSAPPTTWDELTAQAKTIKAKGIANYPVILLFAQDDPGSIEVWTSMVFSRTDGHLFDSSFQPVFNQPDSAAAKTVDWISSSLRETKILDPSSLQSQEIPVVKSMESGAHTFTILETYNQAELNNPAVTKQAGNFKMAQMPGETHGTVGYVRFYAATGQVVNRGSDVVNAAGKFLEYFGGKTGSQFSPVVKRWAVENGLGFGWKSLWNDSEVKAAFNKWGDSAMLQKNQELARAKDGLTKFYPSWDIFSRAQLQKAYLGQVSTQNALKAMADKWNELKKA
jgi:multiple sugar transport system substrate-binding protein